MKKIIILAIALISISAISAEKTATLNIKKNEFHKDKASRLILGGFIELVSNFITDENGLWAQELINRGFDHIEYENSNSPGTISNWKIEIDSLSESSVKHWSQNYNPNGSWGLKFDQVKGKRISISQNFLLSDSTDYQFYIYTKSDDTLFRQFRVSIYASDYNNNEYLLATNDLQTGGLSWEKKNLYLYVNHDINKNINLNNKSAYIKIESLNNGVFYLDEVSLMPSNNINGIRKEHYDLYKIAKFGVLRYPGGSFADSKLNNWKNTILPIDKRKSPIFLGFNEKPQRFDFGLREYIRFCKGLSIEPYITVNYQNGTAEEAAEIVEFCNGDTLTNYGKQRMQLGDTLPYNVKYFEIGNEQWDNKYDYSVGYLEFYDKMKAKDSSIIAIIDGNCWEDDSFDVLIGKVKDKCQIFGYHPAKGFDSVRIDNENLRYLQSLDAYPEQYLIDFYKKKLIETKLNNKLHLGSTEWWSSNSNGRTWLLDTTILNTSLNASLWNANMLMIYFNNPDVMKIACRTIGLGLIKQGVNKQNKRTIFGSPTFQAFQMFSNHFGENIHYFNLKTDSISNYDIKFWIDNMKMSDALVMSSKDSIFLYFINKEPIQEITLNLLADSLPITAYANNYELWSENYTDANIPNNPNAVYEKHYNNILVEKSVKIKPHSFNILAFPIKRSSDSLSFYQIDTNIPSENSNKNIDKNNFLVYYENITGNLNIQISDFFKNDFNIMLFDIHGKVLDISNNQLNNQINNIKISLTSGVYYAKISDKFGNFIVKPFVVQN